MILTKKPLTILISHTHPVTSSSQERWGTGNFLFQRAFLYGLFEFPLSTESLLLVERGCGTQLFSSPALEIVSLSPELCSSQVHSREILKYASNLALVQQLEFLSTWAQKFLWLNGLPHQAELQQPHLSKPLKCFNSNFLESALSECVLYQTHLPAFSSVIMLMLSANSCTVTCTWDPR